MYKVYFEDGSIFEGGSPTNSKWNDMSKKSIVKLEYAVCNKQVIMEGYEAYNHVIEHCITVGKAEISRLWLMVKKDTDTLIIKFDLRTGKIDYDAVDFGKEWRGKPVTGWKPGIKNGKPRTKIF
ncbi:MAG: hypothetical protein JW924_03235 [Fusobacteriaceae bacterium]|nr:hypothetical protein [Fusobacteriaceae bacterium]